MRNYGSGKESAQQSRNKSDDDEVRGLGYSAAVVATDRDGDRGERGLRHDRGEGEDGSVGSMRSSEMIIKRTDHWKVQYETDTRSVHALTPREDEAVELPSREGFTTL